MAKVQEITHTEEKLKALFLLQNIDSKIDEIRTLRGELPIEVKDLEDELEGLQTRINKLNKELDDRKSFITGNLAGIEKSKELIKRYESQQLQVKNNREYDALTKEIEMQNLEIELANKKIRDTKTEINNKERYLKEAVDKINGRKSDLELKRKELEVITAETRKEEAELLLKSEKSSEKIEDRLVKAYARIRKSYRNGLAVVIVARDACGGCFGKIPPQRQLEIKQRKKIITCEHCGRILVDPGMEEEVVI